MMKLLVLAVFATSITLNAKINLNAFKEKIVLGSQEISIAKAEIILNAFKEKIVLGSQEISIAKAEIIVNKMPTIGKQKNRNYLIITLKTSDNKKIKEKYTLEIVSLPSCKENFSTKVTELRGQGCIVRNLPDSARKGRLVVLHLKDAKGTVHMLKATASEMEVH